MSESVYLARQPPLTETSKVFGYELLYRSTSQAESCVGDKDVAAARVLTDALLSIGLNGISGGCPVFLNLTRSLLLQDLSTLLKPTSAVLDVLSTPTRRRVHWSSDSPRAASASSPKKSKRWRCSTNTGRTARQVKSPRLP